MDNDDVAKMILNITIFIVPIILTIITFIYMRKDRTAESKKSSDDNFFYNVLVPLLSLLAYLMASVILIGWVGGAILNILGFNIY